MLLFPQWFTLKDTESGRVHFRLEWLSLLPSTDHLEQVWVTRHTRFYPPAHSQSNISVVLPRSWRETKALRAKLVIHLLQPSWWCIWTRLRNFLWVILLPAVHTFLLHSVLFSVSVVKLTNSFKIHLSANPQINYSCPQLVHAMWKLTLSSFISQISIYRKLICHT